MSTLQTGVLRAVSECNRKVRICSSRYVNPGNCLALPPGPWPPGAAAFMPVLVQVNFPFQGPWGDEMAAGMRELAESIAKEPGFM